MRKGIIQSGKSALLSTPPLPVEPDHVCREFPACFFLRVPGGAEPERELVCWFQARKLHLAVIWIAGLIGGPPYPLPSGVSRRTKLRVTTMV